jgi:outer membrane lipoprotein-sorting protein
MERILMRQRIACVFLMLITASCAQAQVAAPPPAPLINPVGTDASKPLDAAASLDQVLDALHDIGKDLKDFSADVKLTETDNSTQLSSTRSGKAVYQLKGEGDARLRVTFDKRNDGDVIREEKIEYVLDKGWLVDRDYRKKIEVNRQVLRPGEKVNLLKLGEGPFPLPIGQDKENVLKLFDVKKIDDIGDGPKDSIRLELKPKAGTQFAKKFSRIEVWVDRKTRMPVRIDTLDANETTLRSTELSNIKVNVGLKDDDFALPKIDDNEWSRHDEPFSE